MSREQTPLEIAARDHNWKMGSLRRTRAIILSFEDQKARDLGMRAYHEEVNFQKSAYLRLKTEIQHHAQLAAQSKGS